jgi:hypothetical protein
MAVSVLRGRRAIILSDRSFTNALQLLLSDLVLSDRSFTTALQLLLSDLILSDRSFTTALQLQVKITGLNCYRST